MCMCVHIRKKQSIAIGIGNVSHTINREREREHHRIVTSEENNQQPLMDDDRQDFTRSIIPSVQGFR